MATEEVWRDIASASKKAVVGVRGPIIIGADASGHIGRTAWSTTEEVWFLFSGEELMTWSPIKWVPEPKVGKM